MPDPAWWPTAAQFELFMGGAHVVRQVADPNRTGTADAVIVQSYLDSAIGYIAGRAEVKHDPEVLGNLDARSTQNLRDMALGMAVTFAYERGGQGQVMPPRLAGMAARAQQDVIDLAEGRIRLSRASGQPAAAINQPMGVVDFDPAGTGISRAGFKRGFC